MRKSDELSNPGSCINKSKEDEWVFVLTARDPHAPAAVRKWADDYERAGGKAPKVAEARACADKMEAWRRVDRGEAKPGDLDDSDLADALSANCEGGADSKLCTLVHEAARRLRRRS